MTGKRIYRKKRAAPRARVVRVRAAPRAAVARRRPRSGYGSRIGGALGGMAGGMFGAPNLGRALGSMAGGAIGKIFGSGKYQLQDQMPSENSIMNIGPKQIPEFGPGALVLTHRECLGDVRSGPIAGAFSTTNFPLQPGSTVTFPWLSNIASSYSEYSFLGLVFEYISSSADSVVAAADNVSLGTVIMSTSYDSLSYTTRTACENSEFAVSGKPSQNILHMIECKNRDNNPLSTMYVRSAPVPENRDQRFYDLGNMQVSVTGNQGVNQVLGTLWASYKIVLKKAVLPGSISLAYKPNVLQTYLNYQDITNGTAGRWRVLLPGSVLAGTKAFPCPGMFSMVGSGGAEGQILPNSYMSYALSIIPSSTQWVLNFYALGTYRYRFSYDLYFTAVTGDPVTINAWKTTCGLYKEVGTSHTFPNPLVGYVDGSIWAPGAAIPFVAGTNGSVTRTIDIMVTITALNDFDIRGIPCASYVPCMGSIASSTGSGAAYILFNSVSMNVEFLNGV